MCSRPWPHRLFHSQLCYLGENRLVFQLDRFMFLSSKEFEANSDLSGNLYGSGWRARIYLWYKIAASALAHHSEFIDTMRCVCFIEATNFVCFRDIFHLKHRRVYKYEFVRKAYVVISDPIVARHVLGGNTFSDKGVLAEIFQLIMGKGLIPVDLDAWKLRRRAKSHDSLHYLEAMVKIFSACSEKIILKSEKLLRE
ncbi:hypothetical protein Bca101_091760 [Brassica carinata]